MTYTKEELDAEARFIASELRAPAERHRAIEACVNACAGIPTDKLTPGVVKRLIEACAEIAASYDWLAERRAAGIGKVGSGYDEDTFSEGADHAAAAIAARIRRELGSE